ncbi:MAG TPA: hypothetical protein VGK26_06530 [Thermoanaerobaculia bacterium]|jgi:hypothetical protein
MRTSFAAARFYRPNGGHRTLDSGSHEEYKSFDNMASRNGALLLLLVAAGGCSGSNGSVVLDNGNGSFVVTGDHPPIEGEVDEGEIRGITPTPAPITPVAALETPVPTATPRQR